LDQQKGFSHTQLLAKTLLFPLEEFTNVKHLIIIPDAPLNLVPFHALGDPRDQYSQPLSESITIEQRTLAKLSGSYPTKQSIKPHQVLVVADPITHSEDPRVKHLTKDKHTFHPFKRLIGTATEANQIQQLTQAQSFIGFEANKNKVMAIQSNNLDTLHFATHAFFNAESPDLSAMVLSAYDENGSSQSSFLRAYEIKNMSLDVNLVVLSGCETGTGGLDDAYGLGGLSQAFLDAGAKQLIASLWQVDDVITTQLMTTFYQFYTAGYSAPKALALAQQSLRNNSRTSHPKYWSGWFIISN
jgi:CHAT domain-containing protein